MHNHSDARQCTAIYNPVLQNQSATTMHAQERILSNTGQGSKRRLLPSDHSGHAALLLELLLLILILLSCFRRHLSELVLQVLLSSTCMCAIIVVDIEVICECASTKHAPAKAAALAEQAFT